MANDGDVLLFSGGHQSFSTLPYGKIASRMAVAVNASTTYTSGTVILSAGANITLGTNGQTVTISGNAAAAAQTNQTVGLYALSQTTGGASSTTLDARTLSINAYGAISVGFNGGSIQLSAPNTVAQSAQTQSVVVLSASNASFTSGTVVISGANGISVGTGAQSIFISGPAMSSFQHNSAAWYSMTSTGQTNASASFLRIDVPGQLSFTRLDVPIRIVTNSSAASNTAAFAMSNVAVLYTRNDSTLNPIVGASNTVTVSWASNTGLASSATGQRLLSFALASNITPGVYWLGVHVSTTSGISQTAAANTTALDATVSMMIGVFPAPLASGWNDIMVATNATIGYWPLMGLVSSAITATNQTIQQSQITQTGTPLQRANLLVNFRG